MQFLDIGKRARHAAKRLAVADPDSKTRALDAIAASIHRSKDSILSANQLDLDNARANGVSGSFLDRLELNVSRFESMVEGVAKIALMDDPVGQILSQTERPNGLVIQKCATPIGVIGVIYESRPNVTADAAALCFKAGNAVILRGGSNAFETNMAIYAAVHSATEASEFARDAVQLIQSRDRSAVGEMLSGMDGNIDLIVPRVKESLSANG